MKAARERRLGVELGAHQHVAAGGLRHVAQELGAGHTHGSIDSRAYGLVTMAWRGWVRIGRRTSAMAATCRRPAGDGADDHPAAEIGPVAVLDPGHGVPRRAGVR